MRQIAGAFAEYEKARLVTKLRHARDRVRNDRGKCEGRKSHAELHPDVVAEVKRLRRASPKTGARLSYRMISEKLAAAGFINERGGHLTRKASRQWQSNLDDNIGRLSRTDGISTGVLGTPDDARIRIEQHGDFWIARVDGRRGDRLWGCPAVR